MEKHCLTTELATSLLECGWSIRLRVSGWSMKPLLKSGCLVRVAPLQEAPRVGEIVLFRTEANRLVSHRVVAASSRSIRTKGDACSQADGLVEQEQILGKVVCVEKPVFIPLTGRAARWTGRVLNKLYPKLVKMKMSVLEETA